MKLVLTLAALVFVLAPALAAASAGVPQFDDSIMENTDVLAYWAAHPLNPENPARLTEIAHPAKRLNVQTEFGGDIQKAIDALPEEGGTLILPAGEYESGFRLFKSNVHFLGEKGTVIKGAKGSAMSADPRGLDYGKMNTEWRVKGLPEYDAFWQKRIRNVYVKDIVFDGRGEARSLLQIKVANGVMFDNCEFKGVNGGRSGHGGMINGTTGSDSMWFRNCHFVGSAPYGLYWDGTFGSGYINCRFENDFGAGLLSMCNDDFTKDLDKDGKFAKKERRNTQYFVCYGCTFADGLKECVTLTANDILLTKNKLEGKHHALVRFNGKTSLIYPKLTHECYNLYVIDNEVLGACDVLAIVDATNDYMPAGQNNKSQLGKYVVKGNKGKIGQLVEEKGAIAGPNVKE